MKENFAASDDDPSIRSVDQLICLCVCLRLLECVLCVHATVWKSVTTAGVFFAVRIYRQISAGGVEFPRRGEKTIERKKIRGQIFNDFFLYRDIRRVFFLTSRKGGIIISKWVSQWHKCS